MFKKFLNWLAGTKPSNKYAHPLDAVTTPNVSAPYKVEPPAETTPLPYVPSTTPPLVVETSPTPEAAPAKKPRKPAVIKAPAKPRAKKTPQ